MQTVKKSIWTALLGGALLFSGCGTAPPIEAPKPAVPAPASGPIAISRVAPVAPGVLVRGAALAECQLQRKVPQVVKNKLGNATLVEDASKSPGWSLALEIVHVDALPGGGFTGPKSITVQGTLYDNGSRVGGFTARSSDPYGVGVCVQLGRAMDEMAGDIRKWLESPGNDDYLGEAKKP